MYKPLLLAGLLALGATGCNTSLEGTASEGEEQNQVRNPDTYTIDQFLDTEGIFGGSISNDKSNVLVTSNRSGIYNVYEAPVDGGDWSALTSSDSSSIQAISYFPEDDRVLFNMDNNGDEIYHIFVREEDGSIKELTDAEGARASFYGWAHDGKSFFYTTNERDKRYMDLYEMDLADYSSTLLYENTEGYSIGAISPDKKYTTLVQPINTNDSDLFLLNLETKEKTQINENQAANSPSDFSTDSKTLYYTTDEGSEFKYLMSYNIESGEKEKEFESKWDVYTGYFSHNGKYRITLVNEDGKNAVEVIETATGDVVDFPTYEYGDVSSVNISRDESMMTYYVGSSSSPSNLYVFDIASGETTKLSETLNDEIKPNDLVTAEVVRYESFDGTTIPAIYYKPHQASVGEPVPALVWVHGGPGGQSRQSYSGLIQYLVNHGYAVLAVNNRGSSGYGKTFYKMDDRNHGDRDLKDVVEGKNWLAKQDYINSDQIGIIGGSYGGYMVMAALAYQPEEFDVGVNLFGVTNWLRTLKSIPPWWESFKVALYEEMGDPNTEDSVRLKAISPLYHPENISKPLMVLQGSQDPRVLKVESDEIVEAVEAKGVPVEYVLFEDEGHGFVKKENQIEAYSKILEFLDNYLKKEGSDS